MFFSVLPEFLHSVIYFVTDHNFTGPAWLGGTVYIRATIYSILSYSSGKCLDDQSIRGNTGAHDMLLAILPSD